MKTAWLVCLTALLSLTPLFGHGDGEKKTAGPNGGRVITAVEPHVEFLVQADRKVKLTFLSEELKVVAAKDQTASIVCGDRSNPTKLTFTKEGDALVSDKPLPEGNLVPVVLTVKPKPDDKAVIQKFEVNLANCSGCKHQEYACTCEH